MRPVRRLPPSDTGISDDESAPHVDDLIQAIGAVPDAMVMVDADGMEVLRNEAAERFRDARHGDALINSAMTELLGQARRGHSSQRELQLFGPPAETLRLWARPLVTNSMVTGAVAFVRDVTEARRIETMRRDFIGNVTHELKTPIGALALLADTMAMGGDEATLRLLAERIAREADRLGSMVDDLLTLNTVEAQERPTRASVPVSVLVKEAVERVRPIAVAAAISLTPIEPLSDTSLSVDRHQVVSAVANLIENAVKYSDAGSSVDVEAYEPPGFVVIEVRDQGIGIPSGDLERVFERFYRVDRARSRATGGTGLGLSIVRHVAQAHGGDVQVQSHEGEGSTFRLRLPTTGADIASPFIEDVS